MTGKEIIKYDISEQLFPMAFSYEFVKKDQFVRTGFIGGMVSRTQHLEFGRLSVARNEMSPSENISQEFIGYARANYMVKMLNGYDV